MSLTQKFAVAMTLYGGGTAGLGFIAGCLITRWWVLRRIERQFAADVTVYAETTGER